MSGGRGGAGARAARLLQCVAELGEEFTVTTLAKHLELAPSTVHRLLQSMVGTGMIERSGSDSYRPGRELFRMAALLVQRFDLRAIARPILRSLWTDWQETCSLCLYQSESRTGKIIDTIASAHALRYVIEPSATVSLGWGSLGPSILAYLPNEDVDFILAHLKQGPLSGRKAPPRAELLVELRRIRRRGFARYEDRALLNIAGIAAPVFSGDSSVIGSIGVSMPAARFRSCDRDALAKAVVAAAGELSSALGSGATGTPIRSSVAK